eukprot:TRINITY_DN18246_c0_g2_i1.p1 TRINITY_DN18246_c0_g2~~TRINITY_DN18246_c0_g2_i1.p1  ORF type:complete len:338 (-),score=24.28 TRINITY_DN18246_c0_g2_i1:187-1200(-)
MGRLTCPMFVRLFTLWQIVFCSSGARPLENRSLEEVSEKQRSRYDSILFALNRVRSKGTDILLTLPGEQTKSAKIGDTVRSCYKVPHRESLKLPALANSALAGEPCTCPDVTASRDAGLQRLALCCHARFAALMEYAARTLPHYGIRFWLSYGTLLSSIREGGFNPYDSDADLAVWLDSDRDRNNFRAWQKRATIDGFNAIENDKDYTALWLDGLHLDMYTWHKDGTGKHLVDASNDGLKFSHGVMFPLALNCNMHGFLMPCPARPTDVLQHTYASQPRLGSNLAVPVHQWCPSDLPRCQHPPREWDDILHGIKQSMSCLHENDFARLIAPPSASKH